jgi:hypothetical protein
VGKSKVTPEQWTEEEGAVRKKATSEEGAFFD